MSQFYINPEGISPPPVVPTDFVTDVNSPAVPIANVLNIVGGSTTADVDDGIRTDGSSGSNTITIELTNRIHGMITTTDATPTTVVSFTMVDVGTYIFEIKSSALNTTDSLGAGYSLFGTARYDGADSFLCGTPDKIVNEESGMGLCDISMSVGGVGSGLVEIQVTGLAGKTINWCSVGTYCAARFI